MKINIILPFTFLTGGIRVIFLYANYFISQGHDVICYVPMKAYKFNNSILKVIRLSITNTLLRGQRVKWFDCKFKVKLVPVINNLYVRNADISIATAWPTAYDVNKFNDKKGEKVYFIQDYEIWSGEEDDVDYSYKLPLNRIVITNKLKELLNNKFNVNSTVIYNGLNYEEFIYGEKKHNEIKTISMLYNEAPNKGTKEGIKILTELYQKYKIRIVLFGYKKGNSIPNQFEFYENPDRNTLINIYRQADIYVFPSKHESWGLPAMEAMANKCAVVGNNVGCIEELCEDGKNALIVKNLEYNNMKNKIELLLKNEKLLNNIQENGYELAKRFKWSNSFYKFEIYLLDLLKK